MNIRIEHTALKPESGNYVFRLGTLTALRRLQDAGYAIFINDQELDDQQQALFNQEGINPHVIGSENTDYSVKMDASSLALADDAGKILIKTDDWSEIVRLLRFPERKANIKRKTRETDISVELNLDGEGKSDIKTGIGFFDHMLDQIAKHSLTDLKIHCTGDLEIDEHHTVEDVAIALGQAITKALGDKKGIERYGFVLPMDESRSTVALDLSGRPYFVFDGTFTREYVGEFPTEMTEHFFYSLAMNLNATLHISVVGSNDHHKIEACFKGFARTLRQCVYRDERNLGRIPSSKGVL